MSTYGIVGLGVMGGSFASRLKELGHQVIGFDISQETLEYAAEKNLIDQGFTDPASGLGQCEVVIFCLYPTKMAPWLAQYKTYLSPDTLILEISGVKEGILEGISKEIPKDCELVSVHPMCGRESRGIQFSSPAIFQGANFIIIEEEWNSLQALKKVEDLAGDLGCKNISFLSAEEHDRMIAFLSQLTHVIAVCLMNTHENDHLVKYTGDSFRDLTRIAKINEDMWSELFVLNKELLLSEISQFENTLASFKAALVAEDQETMKACFVQSTQRRKKFD